MSHVVTDQRNNGSATIVAILAAVLTAGYMVPWLVAAARGKSNHWTVFWVNLLLGWTVVGWVVAIIMALGPHRVISVHR
jgi:Superinfection immunity protein